MAKSKIALLNTFKKAHDLKLYTFVKVSIFDKEELIINKPSSAKSKMEYYKNAYTDLLKLNSNENIRIIDFGCMNRQTLLLELKNNLL